MVYLIYGIGGLVAVAVLLYYGPFPGGGGNSLYDLGQTLFGPGSIYGPHEVKTRK